MRLFIAMATFFMITAPLTVLAAANGRAIQYKNAKEFTYDTVSYRIVSNGNSTKFEAIQSALQGTDSHEDKVSEPPADFVSRAGDLCDFGNQDIVTFPVSGLGFNACVGARGRNNCTSGTDMDDFGNFQTVALQQIYKTGADATSQKGLWVAAFCSGTTVFNNQLSLPTFISDVAFLQKQDFNGPVREWYWAVKQGDTNQCLRVFVNPYICPGQ